MCIRDRTWSEPNRVAAGAPLSPTPKKVSRGEDAQIAVRGDGPLMAVWPGRGGGVWGSGPLGTAVSIDGGRTWTPGPDPAPFDDDGSGAQGARFPALSGGPGGFDLVWIDASDDRRSVRFARSGPKGLTWEKPRVLDATSCACCWNELARDKAGQIVVVYRDESPRDMKARTSSDGGRTWQEDVPVGDFGWAFNGCPHVGAGLGFDHATGRLHAAVWSGQDGRVGVYALYSDDAGANWSEPIRLGTDRAAHPRLAATDRGVAVAWTEAAARGPRIDWAWSPDGGRSWSPPQAVTTPGAEHGYPTHALVTHASGVVTLHWTQAYDDRPATVHSRRLGVPATP